MLDPESFLARYDEHLLYDFGELWVASLVASCGQEAPARLLKALASPSGPQSLLGRSLWRHALQQGGCDIDRVAVRYERQLASLAAEARELPVATGHFVGQEGERLVFQVRVDVRSTASGPIRVVVRARESPRTPPDQIESASLTVAPGAQRAS